MIVLHIGGASTAAVLVTVIAIFFLIFAMSFALGSVPEGERRFSSAWFAAWSRASIPRFIVAGTFALLVYAGSALSGGGSSSAQSCDSPLGPLTGRSPSDARIVLAISGMREIADVARTGDGLGAQALFYTSDAHNFTHDVSGALFLEDRSLARRLCEDVIALEDEMAGDLRPERIAEQADAIADTLATARATLDLSAVATALPGVSGVCAAPIGAVTSDLLTERRILAAAAALRQAAGRAAEGDLTAAGEAFSGDAHNMTHDIDGPLRNVDADLAVRLCESVVVIETELGGNGNADLVAQEAEKSAELLEDAGRALGIVG